MALDKKSQMLQAKALRALGTKTVDESVAKVRAIIGVDTIPNTQPLAQTALKKMHEGEIPTSEELTALEIVVRLMRPVVLSHNCSLDDLPDTAGHNLHPQELKDAWGQFRQRIQPVVCSIGRVELNNGTHVGTGFLVADTWLATNRHVLGAMTYGSEKLSANGARVVFKGEAGLNDKPADIVSIRGVVTIHATLDVVLLEVEKQDRPVVKFEPNSVAEGARVVVIGYPAEDRRNNPIFLDGVFSGNFGKKRAALGEILDGTQSPALFHDCSTTQGNSGSPIFSLNTGLAAGIHRAGFFMYRNEGIDADALRSFIANPNS
jgi:V8-like Glu-specific endopeptidase